MHQNVRDARVALLDLAFDAVCDLVAFMDGYVAIHSHMKIDVKVEPHFSGATFLNFDHSRN